jgi:hypothetical protein
MNRVCKKCGEEKPLEEFSSSKACGTLGKRHTCKKCHTANSKKWYASNRDTVLAKRKIERDEQPDRSEVMRLARYDLTLDSYRKIRDAQQGKCAVCGNKPEDLSDGRTGLVVDHDHVNGKVRSLLCHACNVGLGNFKDNPDFLRKAASYIEKHSQSEEA